MHPHRIPQNRKKQMSAYPCQVAGSFTTARANDGLTSFEVVDAEGHGQLRLAGRQRDLNCPLDGGRAYTNGRVKVTQLQMRFNATDQPLEQC